MRLLLHAGGNVTSAMEETAAILGGARSAVFVPHAGHDLDGHTRRAGERFAPLGIRLIGVHALPEPAAALEHAQAIVVGGGNSFRLVRALHELRLLEPIRRAVAAGAAYWGASAGANIACPTIRTTNDMPIVEPPSLEALKLVPFQINPHFIDPPPPGMSIGETREERLLEFLEENDVPVVALREGSWLSVDGSSVMLRGAAGAVLFRRAHARLEMRAGMDLSFLPAEQGRFDLALPAPPPAG